MKKRLDSTRRELCSFEGKIEQLESLLGQGGGDTEMASHFGEGPDVILEEETVKMLGEGGTQAEGTAQQSTAGPPDGEQAQEPMETNAPPSPVSPHEDDLLTGAGAATAAAAVGVETELASLRVTSSPEGEQDNQ